MVSGSLEWGGSGQLILVVDDQQDVRESLRRLLELYGYRVETAAEGRRGLEMLIELRPPLALIDIGLPILNGYEIARLARNEHLTTQLVALTGYASETDRRLAAEAGFDAHFKKGDDPGQMLALISELLSPTVK